MSADKATQFDLASLEAEIALKLIRTDQLPAVAQHLLEAGFEGPRVVRMAILEPAAGWEIDQALPLMLQELGCRLISPRDAALRLAHQRARRILESGEDPLASLPYFYELAVKADYPRELLALCFFDDYDDLFLAEDRDEKRARAHTALKELLSPQLHEKEARRAR